MNTTTNSKLQAYLASLAYPAPQLGAAPEPVTTAASRRAQYEARLTPLRERLSAALAKLPNEMLAEGVHISCLWPLVSGVQRSKPRAFEVAEALRKLGWQRIRVYSDGTSPSGSFWFPPEVDVAEAKAILKGKV